MGQKFSRYMLAYAQHGLQTVLNKIHLPSQAKTLLDIGGSHGLYSIALCQKYPGLKATIFDLPDSLKETPALIKKHQMQKRVRVVSGNTMTDDWGQSYDAVLFFSLIHNHTHKQNQYLFKKIFKSLNPGGILIIHDYMSDQKMPKHNTAFNLTLFLEVGTQIFSFSEISKWLLQAGFLKPQKIHLSPIERGSLLIAKKPNLRLKKGAL